MAHKNTVCVRGACRAYSRVHVGKHFSYTYAIKNYLRQWDALLPLLFFFAVEFNSIQFNLLPSIYLVQAYHRFGNSPCKHKHTHK